jgi:ligand-binding sensor domain-containing protein
MFRRIAQLLICFTALLLFSTRVFSQELLFSSLNNEVQLPSQECYQIIQDKKGYIWFSTDNGLCRYGGNKLEVFDKKNGLPEENVYAIFEDKRGKIWFATSKNRILYYDNGKLKEALFNKQYQAFGKGIFKNAIPSALDMDDLENSIISNSYYTAKINQKKNGVSLIKRAVDVDIVYRLKKRKGHPYLSIRGIDWEEKWKEVVVLLGNETHEKKFNLPELNKRVFHWHTPTSLAGNTDFIGIHNQLIRVDAELNHTVQAFPDRILSLYADKSNGLWVGVLNHGVYYYPDVNTMQLGHHSLRNYSVSGICEDHERGVWCTTLEKGIQYSRNKSLLAFTSTEGLDRSVSLLKYLDGNLYASSTGNQLFVNASSGRQFNSYSLPFGKEVFFSDILPYKGHWILSSKVTMIETDKTFGSAKFIHYSISTAAAYQLVKYRNRVYGVMITFIYELKDPEMEIELIANNLPFKSKSVLNYGKGQLLLGGDQGVFKYNLHTGKHARINGIPEKVTGLLKSSTGKIWVITADDDIYWIDGDQITSAGKQLKLKAANLYDITEDRYGTIWVASNEGLYRFSKQGKSYKTSLYTIHNGLPSNEVYKVAADKESIWFSTFEGLFSLPLDEDAKNLVGPSIRLQKMTVNKQAVKESHVMNLAYNQNDLHFTFDILTYKNGMLNQLVYVLSDGRENKTMEVNSNEVFLENLSPGSYKLAVYGVNNDGVKSSQPEVFNIVITAPFWQTGWFISIAVLLFAIGIVWLVRVIVGNVRKAEEAKTLVNKMMAEYQITALQAQMNPHFIFNAINTIQGYILGKNESEAYSYLAKFSKLIRMVLHNSQMKVLRLERELEVLHLYIELEQLRFDHCFDYELVVAEGTELTDFNIPGMLLQPYIENAIWHGIVNLENSRRGKLTLFIKHNGEQLLFTITDNGVGREKAKTFRANTHHKSVGMELTGERLEVMNRLHGDNIASVKVTDLFDEEGIPSGTKVEISIPTNI